MSVEFLELVLGDGDPSEPGINWGALEDSRKGCWTHHHKVAWGVIIFVSSCSVLCLGVLMAPCIKAIARIVMKLAVGA